MAPSGTDLDLFARLEEIDLTALGALLDEDPGLRDPGVVEHLGDEVARLVHVDLDRAERIALVAETLARLTGDDHARARAARARAHVLYAKGEHETAVDRYGEALRLFEGLGEDSEAGRTLSSSLQPLIYLGRYPEAYAAADRAREIFLRTGDTLRLARLDTNRANLHYRLDEFQQAMDLYRAAYVQFQGHGEPRDVAVALRNIAVCHISLNRFEDAVATYQEARVYAAEHGLARLVVEADYNIAYLHYLRGEFTRAIELYQLARERAEGLGDRYHAALCDLDQSELYLELNLVGEAGRLAAREHEAFSGLDMRYEAAKSLVNLALAAGRQGEAFRALEMLVRARAMFEAEGNRVWPPLIDCFRAVVLQQEGRAFEARRYAESARAAFEDLGLTSRAAMCDLVLARTHLELGELVSARRCGERALERLGSSSGPSLSYRAHFILGQAHEALGDMPAALDAYREAQARLETLRSHLEQDELKVRFLKDKLAVYEALVAMTLSGPDRDLEQAHAYMEQAKSRSLADLLAFRASALRPRDPARSGLADKLQGLRQELNWYYRKLDLAGERSEASAGEIGALRKESRDREDQLVRALRDLRSRDAEFTSLQTGGAIALEQIRSTLPEDAVILEYYQARGTLLATVIGRDRIDVVPLTPTSRVQHVLRLLQFQLAKFRLGPEYVRTFGDALDRACGQHLRELHAELIAPVRHLLDAEQLIVVPHDLLHYVPIHALHDGSRYVIDEMAVSYAPSASVHHLCRVKRPQGEGSLVLGVPDAATPFIEHEVKAVAAALPAAKLFLGEDAREETLRRHGPSSRYIHIATHGLFRYDNPMFSSLQLGTSRLSLFDLYQLDLGAELVTLSGCGTGLTVVEGGDELMGLVRGLLYAGSQAALVTLWDVNDESTADFMCAFYPALQRTANKAAALRHTMLGLRDRYPHPFHWAPFVLVGAAQGEKETPFLSPPPNPR